MPRAREGAVSKTVPERVRRIDNRTCDDDVKKDQMVVAEAQKSGPTKPLTKIHHLAKEMTSIGTLQNLRKLVGELECPMDELAMKYGVTKNQHLVDIKRNIWTKLKIQFWDVQRHLDIQI